MLPTGHLVVSAAVGGGVWAATGSPWAMAGALVGGVLVDGDHLLELYRFVVRRDLSRIVVPLHGYELVALTLLAAFLSGWYPLLTGGAMGFAAHVVSDAFANGLHPLGYFLTYRVRHGFRRDVLAPGTEEQARREIGGMIGVPWLMRQAERWSGRRETDTRQRGADQAGAVPAPEDAP